MLFGLGKNLVLVDERMHLDLVADQRFGRHRPGLVQHLRGEIGDADMSGLAVFLGLTQRGDRDLERDVLVVPMDQQQVDVRQLQIGEALVEHLDEICRPQVLLPHLGADEHVFPLDAGLAQPLADLLFVAVKPAVSRWR